MKISVITPSKNSGLYIRQTAESVLSQTGPFELEYIVRDGLSSDNTLDILSEFKGRCSVVSEKDGSPQEAINAGMAMATGDIGAWLNADDVYEPGALEAVAKAFNDNPSIQWLYGGCRIVDENGREVRRPITLYKEALGFVYSKDVLLCENFISQPAVFWRMDFWRSGGGLNSKRHKAAWDYELWLKMAMKSNPLHLRRNLASFRRHPGSISENNFERQFAEELEIACEYGNFLHRSIHRFNAWKIVTAYKIMNSLAGSK